MRKQAEEEARIIVSPIKILCMCDVICHHKKTVERKIADALEKWMRKCEELEKDLEYYKKFAPVAKGFAENDCLNEKHEQLQPRPGRALLKLKKITRYYAMGCCGNTDEYGCYCSGEDRMDEQKVGDWVKYKDIKQVIKEIKEG